MAVNLREQRVRASNASGGTSTVAIYSIIEHAIEEHDLRGQVLDLGSGIGQLTRRLLAMNRFDHVVAADIMKAPDDLTDSVVWIEKDLNSAFGGYESAFDLIVSAEVIEHLENPRFTIREIFRLLRPGGTAIITTPNNESLRSIIALLIRGHYAGFGETSYPAHITALLRKDITRIFLEAGFNEPKFHFTDYGGIPGKPDVTWQSISQGLLGGLRFSDNLMAIADKPS